MIVPLFFVRVSEISVFCWDACQCYRFVCIVFFMAEESFTVFNLIKLESKGRNSLNLKCIGGRLGLRKKICNGDINRPGLALTGFFECFEGSKIQLFGAEEVAYLERLKSENRTDTIRTFFSYDIPCVVFTGGISESSLYKEFMDIAEEVGCRLRADAPPARLLHPPRKRFHPADLNLSPSININYK